MSGFWLRAILSNKMLAMTVQEKDRAILNYLIDIRLELHDPSKGAGFTLFFDFEPNSYFSNTTLTKKYIMSSNNVIDICEGCEIKWTAGSDPTKTKKKKNSDRQEKTGRTAVSEAPKMIYSIKKSESSTSEKVPPEENKKQLTSTLIADSNKNKKQHQRVRFNVDQTTTKTVAQ